MASGIPAVEVISLGLWDPGILGSGDLASEGSDLGSEVPRWSVDGGPETRIPGSQSQVPSYIYPRARVLGKSPLISAI